MSDSTPVTFDLENHELTRLSAVLTAECDARRLLYSSLDANQRRIHQQLTEAGILNG